MSQSEKTLRRQHMTNSLAKVNKYISEGNKKDAAYELDTAILIMQQEIKEITLDLNRLKELRKKI